MTFYIICQNYFSKSKLLDNINITSTIFHFGVLYLFSHNLGSYSYHLGGQ